MYLLEGADGEATLARIGKGLGSSVLKTLSNTSIVRTSPSSDCCVSSPRVCGTTSLSSLSERRVPARRPYARCLPSLLDASCTVSTVTKHRHGGSARWPTPTTQPCCAAELGEAGLHRCSQCSGRLRTDWFQRASLRTSLLSSSQSWRRNRSSSARLRSHKEAKHDTHSGMCCARYTRPRLSFEWQDGPLVPGDASRRSQSCLTRSLLPDDSVLERLNSVPRNRKDACLGRACHFVQSAQLRSRHLVIADYWCRWLQVLATMNPGGDYGKKELSPALRNRFTEIWVPHVDIRADLIQIINAQWKARVCRPGQSPSSTSQIGSFTRSAVVTSPVWALRDLLTWASFMNELVVNSLLDPALAFAHGASLTIIDGLGALPATSAMTSAGLDHCARSLSCQGRRADRAPQGYDPKLSSLFEVEVSDERLRIGPFMIPRGNLVSLRRDLDRSALVPRPPPLTRCASFEPCR